VKAMIRSTKLCEVGAEMASMLASPAGNLRERLSAMATAKGIETG
jgi:hypothetical protein